MKTKILIVTIKSWNIDNFLKFKDNYKDIEWLLITKKEEFSIEKIKLFNPRYIFFPHWSWIIPKEIYENFECIVFHMTDLPFGRGGSPLQNLISRGIYKTKISAIKVVKELDAGDIYCKESLDISDGSANQIFQNISNIIYNKMIPYIINNKPIPKKQKGEIIEFKRRTSEQSDISKLKDINLIYDYIRMLNGEGYPEAFINTNYLNLKFYNAKKINNKIIANVEIIINQEVKNEK
jgi:methionyl-tRNA formyltransferase